MTIVNRKRGKVEHDNPWWTAWIDAGKIPPANQLYRGSQFARQYHDNLAIQNAVRGQVGQRTRSGSKTTTKSKTRPEYGMGATGECSSSSSSVHTHRLSEAVYGSLTQIADNFTNSSSGTQVNVVDGQTLSTVLATLCDTTELVAIQQVTSAATNSKFAYLGGKCQIMITNHGNTTGFFKLWVLRQRVASTLVATTAYSQGVDQEGGTSTSYTDFGSSPIHSNEFRRFKGVRKLVKFCLAPGQTHTHTFYNDIHAIFDGTLTTYTNNSLHPLWTTEFMLQVHGQAACDSSGANVTTAGVQYNFIVAKRHHSKQIEEFAPVVVYNTTLPTKGSITEDVYNTDTSAKAVADFTD